MDKKIIAFCGPAGAGKDTVADHFIENYGYKKVSFAAPLYRAVSAMLNIPIETLKNRESKEKVIPGVGYSPRFLLQTLGTEWGREQLDEDFWIRLAERSINEIRAAGEGIVITDARFQNEVNVVKNLGGILIHVQRDVRSVGDHASESSEIWKQADFAIDNNRSLGALQIIIEEFIHNLRTEIWK